MIPLDKTSTDGEVTRASRSGYLSAFDESTLSIHHGENLPHWTCDNAVYHVVFRLADAVPHAKREEWLAERKRIEDTARNQNRDLTEEERKRLQFLYSERIEKYLDTGHGACHLRRAEVAEMVANAIRHFEGDRYRLHAWCVMPNHVHVIVEPLPDWKLSGILHSWKSFTAHQANQMLKRSGDFWQRDAYNHIIRNEKEYWFQIRYVWENPDKAGLNDWKWRWIIGSASRVG
ncbi:transposase [Desulfatirhabdium butyrativorans]|uniref:transposase n=1 Tax=Desulfatirhabdium butyrativorans TaxID=340467 RepID=UPI000684A77D|nr:transposase [Desulfatirhabdium butyrativorans]